jgi:GNAT superfamily N-acetyltransferase
MNNHIFSHAACTPADQSILESTQFCIYVTRIKTLEVQIAANDELMEIDFRELTKLAEKMKWMECFTKNYSDGVCTTTSGHFDPTNTKFIVATAANKDVGYVGLVKHSYRFPLGNVDIWVLETAYVKPKYRSLGVLKKLIAHATEVYDIKKIHIEDYRFFDNQHYYECLGFTDFNYDDETSLGFAINDSCKELFAKMIPLAA